MLHLEDQNPHRIVRPIDNEAAMGTSPSFILKFADDEVVPFSRTITERVLYRDARAHSHEHVEWRTGEAWFELDADKDCPDHVKLITIERFTCVVLFERVYELMLELGVVFADMDGYFIARANFQPGRVPADLNEDLVHVVDSCDDFIEQQQVIFCNCGPEATQRSTSRELADTKRPIEDEAVFKAVCLPLR
jgi:hypothetical protein